MKNGFWTKRLRFCQEAPDAEYESLRKALERAGLDEETLRRMEPDDRVAALERVRLDPYDYI